MNSISTKFPNQNATLPLPLPMQSGALQKEMDSKCEEYKSHPLSQVQLEMIKDIYLKERFLLPREGSSPQIKYSLHELQSYLKTFFSKLNFNHLFISGSSANYIMMTSIAPETAILPNDLDLNWYIGEEFELYREDVWNAISRFFAEKISGIAKDINPLQLILEKYLNYTKVDSFSLVQLTGKDKKSKVDIKLCGHLCHIENTTALSDCFQIAVDHPYAICIFQGVICDKKQFDKAIYESQYRIYNIAKSNSIRELLFRIIFKMTEGQEIGNKLTIFQVALINNNFLLTQKYEKFKRRFNANCINHFPDHEKGQMLGLLNGLQIGVEAAKINTIANLSFPTYALGVIEAWTSRTPRILTTFSELVNNNTFQLTVIVPHLLNVVRGIFLNEWMNRSVKGEKTFGAFTFPFASHEKPLRMQFSLNDNNTAHYLALEEHHDPFTLAQLFIESWIYLENTLSKEDVKKLAVLPNDLGISMMTLIAASRKQIIVDMVEKLTSPQIGEVLQKLFKDKTPLIFFEMLLDKSSNDLDTKMELHLQCKIAELHIAKNKVLSSNSALEKVNKSTLDLSPDYILTLQLLYRLRTVHESSSKSLDNSIDPLLRCVQDVQKYKEAVHLKSKKNLQATFKKVIFETLQNSKSIFTTKLTLQTINTLLHICEDTHIFSSQDMINAFHLIFEACKSADLDSIGIDDLLCLYTMPVKVRQLQGKKFVLSLLIKALEPKISEALLKKSHDMLQKGKPINEVSIAITCITSVTKNQNISAKDKAFIDLCLKRFLDSHFSDYLREGKGSHLQLAFSIIEAGLQNTINALSNDEISTYMHLSEGLELISSDELDTKHSISHYRILNCKLLNLLFSSMPKVHPQKHRIIDSLLDQMAGFLTSAEQESKLNCKIPQNPNVFNEASKILITQLKPEGSAAEILKEFIKLSVTEVNNHRSEVTKKFLIALCQMKPDSALEKLRQHSFGKIISEVAEEEVALSMINASSDNREIFVQYDAWEYIRKNYKAGNAPVGHVLKKISASIRLLDILSKYPDINDLEENLQSIFNFIIKIMSTDFASFAKTQEQCEELNQAVAKAALHLMQMHLEAGLQIGKDLFAAAKKCNINIESESSLYSMLMNMHLAKDKQSAVENLNIPLVSSSEAHEKNIKAIIDTTLKLVEQCLKDTHASSVTFAMSAVIKLFQSKLVMTSLNKEFMLPLVSFMQLSSLRNKKIINVSQIKDFIQALFHHKIALKLPDSGKLALLDLAIYTCDAPLLKNLWEELQTAGIPIEHFTLFITKKITEGATFIEKSGIFDHLSSLLFSPNGIAKINLEIFSKLFHEQFLKDTYGSPLCKMFHILNLIELLQRAQTKEQSVKVFLDNFCQTIFKIWNSSKTPHFPNLATYLSNCPKDAQHVLNTIRGGLFLESTRESKIHAFQIPLEGNSEIICPYISFGGNCLMLSKNDDPISVSITFVASVRALLTVLENSKNLDPFSQILQDFGFKHNILTKEFLSKGVLEIFEALNSISVSEILLQLKSNARPEIFYESISSHSVDDLCSSMQLELHQRQAEITLNTYQKKIDREIESKELESNLNIVKKHTTIVTCIQSFKDCLLKIESNYSYNPLIAWMQKVITDNEFLPVFAANKFILKTFKITLLESINNTLKAVSQTAENGVFFPVIKLAAKLGIFDASDYYSTSISILSTHRIGIWSNLDEVSILFEALTADVALAQTNPELWGRLNKRILESTDKIKCSEKLFLEISKITSRISASKINDASSEFSELLANSLLDMILKIPQKTDLPLTKSVRELIFLIHDRGLFTIEQRCGLSIGFLSSYRGKIESNNSEDLLDAFKFIKVFMSWEKPQEVSAWLEPWLWDLSDTLSLAAKEHVKNPESNISYLCLSAGMDLNPDPDQLIDIRNDCMTLLRNVVEQKSILQIQSAEILALQLIVKFQAEIKDLKDYLIFIKFLMNHRMKPALKILHLVVNQLGSIQEAKHLLLEVITALFFQNKKTEQTYMKYCECAKALISMKTIPEKYFEVINQFAAKINEKNIPSILSEWIYVVAQLDLSFAERIFDKTKTKIEPMTCDLIRWQFVKDNITGRSVLHAFEIWIQVQKAFIKDSWKMRFITTTELLKAMSGEELSKSEKSINEKLDLVVNSLTSLIKDNAQGLNAFDAPEKKAIISSLDLAIASLVSRSELFTVTHHLYSVATRSGISIKNPITTIPQESVLKLIDNGNSSDSAFDEYIETSLKQYEPKTFESTLAIITNLSQKWLKESSHASLDKFLSVFYKISELENFRTICSKHLEQLFESLVKGLETHLPNHLSLKTKWDACLALGFQNDSLDKIEQANALLKILFQYSESFFLLFWEKTKVSKYSLTPHTVSSQGDKYKSITNAYQLFISSNREDLLFYEGILEAMLKTQSPYFLKHLEGDFNTKFLTKDHDPLDTIHAKLILSITAKALQYALQTGEKQNERLIFQVHQVWSSLSIRLFPRGLIKELQHSINVLLSSNDDKYFIEACRLIQTYDLPKKISFVVPIMRQFAKNPSFYKNLINTIRATIDVLAKGKDKIAKQDILELFNILHSINNTRVETLFQDILNLLWPLCVASDETLTNALISEISVKGLQSPYEDSVYHFALKTLQKNALKTYQESVSKELLPRLQSFCTFYDSKNQDKVIGLIKNFKELIKVGALFYPYEIIYTIDRIISDSPSDEKILLETMNIVKELEYRVLAKTELELKEGKLKELPLLKQATIKDKPSKLTAGDLLGLYQSWEWKFFGQLSKSKSENAPELILERISHVLNKTKSTTVLSDLIQWIDIEHYWLGPIERLYFINQQNRLLVAHMDFLVAMLQHPLWKVKEIQEMLIEKVKILCLDLMVFPLVIQNIKIKVTKRDSSALSLSEYHKKHWKSDTDFTNDEDIEELCSVDQQDDKPIICNLPSIWRILSCVDEKIYNEITSRERRAKTHAIIKEFLCKVVKTPAWIAFDSERDPTDIFNPTLFEYLEIAILRTVSDSAESKVFLEEISKILTNK